MKIVQNDRLEFHVIRLKRIAVPIRDVSSYENFALIVTSIPLTERSKNKKKGPEYEKRERAPACTGISPALPPN
jgi:hypothetical protein